jgi:hypothetical protein
VPPPGLERRRPFGLVAQGAVVAAVLAVWFAGIALVGAGSPSEDFDGGWSAPVLRLLAAAVGAAGAAVAARTATRARAGDRPSAARFCASAVPVSLAGGLVALVPDRPEVAVASFALTGVLLSWGLWWWHEVRRTRYALVALAVVAHGAGMLWPGWSGASGRLLAALAVSGYLVVTTADIAGSLSRERAGDRPAVTDSVGGDAAATGGTPSTSSGPSEPLLTDR